MIQYSLLDEPIVSTIDRETQQRSGKSLPAVLAALVRDEIDDFPALRPHQRHVWHAFLVQLAAIYLHRSGTTAMPDDEAEWRSALLSLTPDDQDGAAWALISPVNRPALLQPPVPEGSLAEFKRIGTPDALDFLVTAKNHDVKRGSMRSVRAEHWLFALLSLQTQEGFLGAGNYGISRMNGGFASRPAIGVCPSGGPGRRFVRDGERLVSIRGRLLDEYDAYPSTGGHALLWLLPWSGETAVSLRSLDLFYVEICRRVRLVATASGGIEAAAKGTKSARIESKTLKGRTGDAWTPLVADGAERKALTIDPGSFGFKRLTGLLFPRISDVSAARRAPLQEIGLADDQTGLTVVAQGTVRGQGKTEGYHERRVAVSQTMRRFLVEIPSDEGAAVAEDRVRDAGTLARKVLYPAALGVFTAAPLEGERKRDDDTAKARASRVLDRFDQVVDNGFFDDLSLELDVLNDVELSRAIRATWLVSLMDHARDLLEQCAQSASTAAMRSYRTRARTRDQLENSFRRHFGERVPAATKPHTGQLEPAAASLSSDFAS